jgi:nucleolar protein 4
MEKMNGKPIPKAVPAGAAKGKIGRLNKVTDAEARPVAVDWALSKDQWEKTKAPEAKADGDDAESSSGSDSGSESSGSSDTDSEDEDEDADSDAEMEDVSGDLTMGDGGDAEAEEEDEEEAPVKPTLPTVDVGSTLFIRNLPFEVTEQELNTL